MRFAALGGLSAVTIGLSAYTFGSLQQAEPVPHVHALEEAPPGGGSWPFVSIIVPARNEERNLPRLLPTVLRQLYPDYEVIVVDDQSTDSTPDILAEFARRDARLKIVRGSDLPSREGWMGKPFAMHQGAQAARGEWLLFTDADTTHSPLALSSTVAYALGHDVDLLTIFPTSELVTPPERLIMPVAFQGIITLYPTKKVNDPRSKTAIANGQFLLMRREVYDAVGGAGRVKNYIAEDLEFAKAVKGDGFRLRLVDGRDLMSVRMYTGLADLWQGWGKNVVLSMRENPASAVLAVLGTFAAAVEPLLLTLWTARTWRKARHGTGSDRAAAWWVTVLTGLNIALPLVYRRRVDKLLGLPPGWAFTQPVGAFIFGLIMLYSLARLLTGRGVVWKGRTYAARTR